jgi:alpha-glucuronidase
MKKMIALCWLLTFVSLCRAEDGYDLWLRYKTIEDAKTAAAYRTQIKSFIVAGNTATSGIIRAELIRGLRGMLQENISETREGGRVADGTVVIGTSGNSSIIRDAGLQAELAKAGEEGFVIRTRKNAGGSCILIAANTEIGALYGSFHFLRLLQTGEPIHALSLVSAPRIKLRMLNHWDNLDRTVERGYAGFSIWDWHRLPVYLDPRYTDYARANASIGINGTVLTNVNANATILTPAYLEKVKALADLFRPYGIKVYLTARFSAPIELGKLKTADPLDAGVQAWWAAKVKEIYSYVPDFGGFLVKANSEGQPGPQDYKRTHADGANMLADIVAPYKGIVMWRAFVYSDKNPDDRHKQAYDEFVPLDGKFRDNVMVQVKNGAIDFMPREPFHPMFGAMPSTSLMMEFQVTQEYLGQATNLVYLAPLFKECLDSDTYSKGRGSTVAKRIDGSTYGHSLTGMAGVANIGNDINWTGHPMAQANWYALGRLAWDHQLSSEAIANEWLRMTYSQHPAFLQRAQKILLESREVLVRFSNPLGLHHIMGTSHHYGPAPWVSYLNRPEWNPVYYHKADSLGIGFNRSSTGSNALAQYHPDARKQWENPETCDEKFLLWFHHVPWDFRMRSGRTLWEELCHEYYAGEKAVKEMQQEWKALQPYVDEQRFRQVLMLLEVQHDEAIWWREACLLYFSQFSRKPIPVQYPQPTKTLDYYMKLRFPFAPGI